jgi:sulfur-carrier protein
MARGNLGRRKSRRIEIALPPPALRDGPALRDDGDKPRHAQGGLAMTTARVTLSNGFSRRYTGGVREFEIEAKNLRGVIKTLDEMYPGLGAHLEEETTVAIDGQLHDQPGYFQPLRQGSEVFFIPKLEGG